jgi:hypothetical protein
MSSSSDQDGPPLPLPPNVNSRSTKNRPANAFDIGNNVAGDCRDKRRKLIDEGIVVVHPKQNEDIKHLFNSTFNKSIFTLHLYNSIFDKSIFTKHFFNSTFNKSIFT